MTVKCRHRTLSSFIPLSPSMSSSEPAPSSEVVPGELVQLAVEELAGKVLGLTGLNLRDVGDTAPGGITPGLVFRSSQVFR